MSKEERIEQIEKGIVLACSELDRMDGIDCKVNRLRINGIFSGSWGSVSKGGLRWNADKDLIAGSLVDSAQVLWKPHRGDTWNPYEREETPYSFVKPMHVNINRRGFKV